MSKYTIRQTVDFRDDVLDERGDDSLTRGPFEVVTESKLLDAVVPSHIEVLRQLGAGVGNLRSDLKDTDDEASDEDADAPSSVVITLQDTGERHTITAPHGDLRRFVGVAAAILNETAVWSKYHWTVADPSRRGNLAHAVFGRDAVDVVREAAKAKAA